MAARRRLHLFQGPRRASARTGHARPLGDLLRSVCTPGAPAMDEAARRAAQATPSVRRPSVRQQAPFMLDRLRDFLSGAAAPTPAERPDDLELAVAALLVEAASID